MTYSVARDRILQAYYKDELNPYNHCACFIGNVLDGGDWAWCRNGYGNVDPFELASIQWILDKGDGVYTPQDIMDMEKNFLTIINQNCQKRTDSIGFPTNKKHPNYENALFLAMDSTLDMLKACHELAGEIIDPPVFVKRKMEAIKNI